MPKQARFDFIVEASPDDVAERLKAKTRYRWMPFQGSPLGGGSRPLGGRVSGEGFRVSLDERHWVQRSLAVAVGEVEAAGEGRTRVFGVAGLPAWRANLFRLAFVMVVAMGLGGGAWALATGQPLEVLAAVTLPFLVWGVVMSVVSLGWNVASADAEIPRLMETLETVLLTVGPPAQGDGVEVAASSPSTDRTRGGDPRVPEG